MKGSGVGDPVNDVQNYSIEGKPNNGPISNTLSAGNGILVGNPFPCAIDADAFLTENGPTGTNSINGALYFWDHYQINFTHVLAEYQGGYAVRNFVGGLAAVTPPITADGYLILGGNGSKIPGRYVPVAQGFFVSASSSGGQVAFNNSQRVFQRETNDNSNDGSQFFRYNDGSSSKEKPKQPSGEEDNNKRLRINFKTPEGAIRPLLLGFVPNGSTTDGVDYGYDAPNYDAFPSDLSWQIDGQPYVIQGVGDFDKSKQYPLDMLLSDNGEVEISLEALENFDHPVNVYVYDAFLDRSTKINNKSFKINLEASDYTGRFFITFTKSQSNNSLDVEDFNIENAVVNYLNKTNEIYIRVPNAIEVNQVYLTNLLGQKVKSWNMSEIPNSSNNEFRIPVNTISEGYYIIKVETNSTTIRKKVIISNDF
jgi:hypothetical protein